MPKTTHIHSIGVFLAAILTLMVVAQLFTFEDFADVLAGTWLPLSMASAQTIVAFVVTLEVLALPFLLHMRLSPLMRVLSMVSGWIVLVVWFGLSIWENILPSTISNAGFLGATATIPVGWWSVFFSLGLIILGAWVSWGMWPGGVRKR